MTLPKGGYTLDAMKRTALSLLGLLLLAIPAAYAQDEFNQAKPDAPPAAASRKHPGFFHRPAKSSPAEQLAYAQSLAQAGKARAAMRQFNDLVCQWHNAPEAVIAQESYARLLLDARRYDKAFEEFQYLVDRFPGRFNYAALMTRPRRLLFFKVSNSGEDALPLFEQIIRNAPDWERTPEAQFFVGAIHEKNGDFDKAVSAYEQVQFRHPNSAFAAGAAYKRANCLCALANEAPRDEVRLREALAALAAFLRDYRGDPNAGTAEKDLEALNDRLAAMYYERASFYDRIARRPESAVIAYRDFYNRFPLSPQAAVAKERAEQLQEQLGEKHAP